MASFEVLELIISARSFHEDLTLMHSSMEHNLKQNFPICILYMEHGNSSFWKSNIHLKSWANCLECCWDINVLSSWVTLNIEIRDHPCWPLVLLLSMWVPTGLCLNIEHVTTHKALRKNQTWFQRVMSECKTAFTEIEIQRMPNQLF